MLFLHIVMRMLGLFFLLSLLDFTSYLQEFIHFASVSSDGIGWWVRAAVSILFVLDIHGAED